MRATRTDWTTAAVILLVGVLVGHDAFAAEGGRKTDAQVSRPPRRVVVSIPNRKLAVLENDKVLHLFPVAVGSTSSPSPVGTLTIVNRIDRPTCASARPRTQPPLQEVRSVGDRSEAGTEKRGGQVG